MAGSSSSAQDTVEKCLDIEALAYIQDSLMNMVDPPLQIDEFMEVEEVLAEMAMYEEIANKKRKAGQDP